MTPYYQDEAVTIYHGDCRELVEWLAGDVMVTDPPYGMNLRSGMAGKFGACEIAGDADTDARDRALDLWGDRPALVFGRWSVARPAGTRAVLTWEKGEHVGMGDLSLPWKPNTEEVYVLGRGFTGRRGGSVLRYLAMSGTQQVNSPRLHEVQKPVELMRDLVSKCPPGVIVDPFAGSGTTLRAAKDCGRRSIGVELLERHCETAARRMGQEVLDLGSA